MNYIDATEQKTELLKIASPADSPSISLPYRLGQSADGSPSRALHKPKRAPWVEELF